MSEVITYPSFVCHCLFFWISREDNSDNSKQNSGPLSNSSQLYEPTSVSPKAGLSDKEARAEIKRFISSDSEDKGSLIPFDLKMFSKNDRAKVKRYGKQWVKQTNDVVLKSLTGGYCGNVEGAVVYRYTANPHNPEIIVDCDGQEFEGTYSDLMGGTFMTINAYQKKQADAYYARAPGEYDSTRACYTAVQSAAKDPGSIDYYPTTAQSGTRPGKDGPEFFLNEDFTAKNGFGANVRNTFYCTVTSTGEATVKYAHR